MISEESVRRALAAIRRPVDQDYFFSKLQSPDWIEPLRKAGLFARTESPIARADGNYYVPWAVSKYLVRMASRAPDAVTRVFEQMEIGENPWVHRDVFLAALAMPGRYAVRLARKEAGWISPQDRISILVASDLAKLTVKLAKEGESDCALDLMRLLFAPLPVPGGSALAMHELNGRLGSQEAEHILEILLSGLAKSIPLEALKLFCELLYGSLSTSVTGTSNHPRDYSEIWRPAIEEHDQNRSPTSLCEILVSAVRDLAVKHATNSLSRNTVVDLLESYGWNIFRRLAMHVLCMCEPQAIEKARVHLLDRGNFENFAVRHEYACLLRRYYSELRPDDQAELLGWVEAGPSDTDDWKKQYKSRMGTLPSDEDVQAFGDRWRLERLHPFHHSLNGQWKHRYDSWRRHFGEPALAEFPVHVETRWGDSSPLSLEEIASMDTTALVDYLRKWKSPADYDGPSTRGLASTLQRAVAADAFRFAKDARAFQDVASGFISSILDGLREAVRAGGKLDWAATLQLCAWVAQHPLEMAVGDEGVEIAESNWEWTRAAVADLVQEGLQRQEEGIPWQQRNEVWSIIDDLIGGLAPPSNEEEQRYANIDAFTASLNNLSGKAMHTLIRYVIWVARNLPRLNADELALRGGIAEIPEALPLLEKHLDYSQDSRLAIRAVFGHFFPLLAAIDATWAHANRHLFFPPDENRRALWTAAWDAYIRFNGVYAAVFEALSTEYARAVERCHDYPSEDREHADALEGLGEHLMILVGRGAVAVTDDLLGRFFEVAPHALQLHTLNFVGRSLARESAPPPEVLLRFCQLWDRLVQSARSSPRGSPTRLRLTAFGSWFASRKFDPAWALTQLEVAMQLSDRIDNAYEVIKALKDHDSQFPLEVLVALGQIIRLDTEGWGVSAAQNEIKKLIHFAITNGGKQVRDTAEMVVHDLGARGFFSYRELLRPA